MTHTPAPWKVETITDQMRETYSYSKSSFFLIKSLNHMNLATVHGWSPEANARLIAAAPNLLEALQFMLNITEPTARPRKGDLEVTRANAIVAIAQATIIEGNPIASDSSQGHSLSHSDL